MKDDKKVPQLRFPEFTDAWKQRKLEQIIDVGSGRDYKHLSEGGIPVYGTGGYMLSVNEALSWEEDAIGIGRKGTIDKPYILQAPFWTVDTLFYAIPKKEQDLDFLYCIFQNIDWKKKDESTGVPSLSKTIINKTYCMTPNYDEQKKIGCFFSKIDNLITLQQRKLNSLQKLKKGLLQKMFPKNGENIPEIRFPEFSDAWKQRKLSDISEKITEKNTELKEQETLTNSAELGIISQSDFFDHRISNESNINNYYVVSPNDFVYNPRISVTAPVGPINRNKLKRTGIMSPLYTVFKTHDVDCSFLEFFFKSSSWHKFMHFNGDSGARSDRFSIKDNVFFTMPIFVPSLSEQVKIGELLSKLDNTITLQQRKLESLQKLKKGLLQQMFI